jgi:hypothetical protein
VSPVFPVFAINETFHKECCIHVFIMPYKVLLCKSVFKKFFVLLLKLIIRYAIICLDIYNLN